MEKILKIKNESTSLEDTFILVEVEKLSLDDKFMQWEPRTDMECNTKELIKKAIYKGVKNFYRPKCDPSYTGDGKNICFLPGKKPILYNPYSWWEDTSRQYCPEHNSRLGTRLEYAAFLGVLIKELVKRGKSIKWAWNAVCNESTKLGCYWDSRKCTSPELTGSRQVCGFCDLANIFKVVADDSEAGGFWTVGGIYMFSGNCNPIATYRHFTDRDYWFSESVGWIVLS